MAADVNSARVSRASASLLLIAGLALLFAADDILPRLIPGFPVTGAWLGQLLGGAWLGVAGLNWLNRGARLGGIYGRPVVATNAIVYFVSAMVLLKIVMRPAAPALLVLVTILFVLFAGLYTWLLYRGPFESERR
jgi:hypothetical protein